MGESLGLGTSCTPEDAGPPGALEYDWLIAYPCPSMPLQASDSAAEVEILQSRLAAAEKKVGKHPVALSNPRLSPRRRHSPKPFRTVAGGGLEQAGNGAAG